MSSDPALEIKGLTVAYDSRPVLWNINLDIPQGVMMGIIGPNGAGKSTLLKSALDLVPKLTGRVIVLGKPLSSNRKQIGYVPQRSAIDWDFPTTVFDLVLMGTYGRLGWFRRPGAKEKRETLEALEKLEIADLRHRQISELSGGQQQRAFLARAFVQDTPIYFLDEPFSGVDVVTEQTTIKLLHELRDSGKTIVIVQHDLATVPQYLDQVTLINRRIISTGPVADAFEQKFIDEAYGCPTRRLILNSVSRKHSAGNGGEND